MKAARLPVIGVPTYSDQQDRGHYCRWKGQRGLDTRPIVNNVAIVDKKSGGIMAKQ